MSLTDTNKVIQAYLLTCGTLTDLVDVRIHCPRLPEKATLPAVSFFTRGGLSTPYIPGIVNPSVQFDCWAANPIDAREVYCALYDGLQGIQNVTVDSYLIMSAIEEVQGQDLVDVEIPNYFRVLTFFNIMIRAE
ncbi:hypothetical protein ES703_49490 [subsurface metagenome]